jgi:hypothetical protein
MIPERWLRRARRPRLPADAFVVGLCARRIAPSSSASLSSAFVIVKPVESQARPPEASRDRQDATVARLTLEERIESGPVSPSQRPISRRTSPTVLLWQGGRV